MRTDKMTYIEELFSLKGRVAIVTGGYGHLGRAMCWALAASGAKVYCAGPGKERFRESFPFSVMEAIASEYPEMGMADISYLPFDLASEASREKALLQVRREAGGLDILVNNAFFLSPEIQNQTPNRAASGSTNRAENFRKDMDGLLNNTSAFTEEAKELLQHSDQGRIVNIASMYGIVAPDPGLYCEHPQQRSRASYGAAKAALLQLTRYWASFWGEECPQLTVNAISPGPFPHAKAPAHSDASPGFRAKLRNRTIVRRTGQPEDLSGALLLLASRAGGYITGQNLVVDGGWTVR
ncbi:SDR family oxidoreductase [Candidatus Haliotispira prima]|uniref:SDR family oxidoreductase n=1 Tax=Candidatus Haliotispira prima TaxID=3034016 RepID=A0ABY8MJ59_9SPIO|nr:SDR family oxidoreductase [Candidatus Haliotispira prima]